MAEANFDGLVGPTHNYAGLSHGNVASAINEGRVARPREAALQGLAKMRFLRSLGVVQGVFPPHERPHVPTLRRLGFTGDDASIVRAAGAQQPLLSQVSSASAMWAANAATVAPSADTIDGRAHFVPANLATTFHRSIEPPFTKRVLERVFPFVAVHDALPTALHFGDEGAANHTRLSGGVHFFVYGRSAFRGGAAPAKFPARQTREASEAVARLCQVPEDKRVFAQQSPAAIDAGVFHNDVIAVGHENVLFFHEDAYLDLEGTLAALRRTVESLVLVRVTRAELGVADVVASYLFNSQLVTTRDGAMALIAPIECGENDDTRRVIDHIVESDDNPIRAVHLLDVRQSMRNGGGPACLRLRVELSPAELAQVRPACLLTDELDARLVSWIETHYREELAPGDLVDPSLLVETRSALDALTQILDLGSIYDFQR